MKSRVIQFVLSLALGALTTLAIAWACAACVNPNAAPMAFSTNQTSKGALQATSVQKRFGHTRINRCTLADLQRDPATGAIQSIGVSGDSYGASESLTGWPLRAMRCVNKAEITIGDGQAIMQTNFSGVNRVGLVELAPWGSTGLVTWRALPDQPVWFGFLIDTILYASVWWLIIFGLIALRRASRSRLGLCPRCAYDLRGHGSDDQVCPECGLTK